MIGKSKAFGFAIAAVLALTAVWAVSAQAALSELVCTPEVGRNTCTVTGTEEEGSTFNVEGGNVRCRTDFHGTMSSRSVTSLILTPIHTFCRAFGVAANVNMGGCTYQASSAESLNEHTWNVFFICPAGRNITISAPSLPCTITIGAQGPLTHAILRNDGEEPTAVTVNVTVSGMNNNQSGAGCPRGGNSNNGTYNFITTLDGFNDTDPLEGNKVGLHVLTTI